METLKKNVLINSRKTDGEICKSWRADLIKTENSLLVFQGVFDTEINHGHLGVIRHGTISYEYFWFGRWFNVFKFYEPEGTFRNFYCNISMPPTFKNNVLDYVDLDIDVVIWKDFSSEILDFDEFESNAKKYDYSSGLKHNAAQALKSILRKIETRDIPFDSLEP